MRCPACGTPLRDQARFCESCGQDISQVLGFSAEDRLDLGRRRCRGCGTPLPPYGIVCTYCQMDNTEKKSLISEKRARIILVIGGVLVIVAGLLSFAASVQLLLERMNNFDPDSTRVSALLFLCACAVIAAVLGFLPIVGRHFELSIVGGVFSLIGGGIFIGVFGLALILIGRKGFREKRP
jgi:predicted nucleic acid-binding Zn ribbon protein